MSRFSYDDGREKNVDADPAKSQVAEAYDQMPYKSAPFSHSRPERLATIASLLGVTPADPREARVLELGCASGGNLIPLAELYPKSTFVGVDVSSRQIADGQAIANQLGLSNLKLLPLDIMHIGSDFGQFDYIIAHGLYSWVPLQVQAKILQIVRHHLAPTGMAYISYNTYPGWRMRGILRDMMLFHASLFDYPSQRVAQARSMVALLAQGGAKLDETYWNLLKREMSLIASKEKEDFYIAHDYMEENNLPCYFHEFASRAAAEGLQYVGEANPLSRPSLSNFPQEVLAAVASFATEMIRQEQYLDFLCNQSFRASVLCRAQINLDWEFNPQRLMNLHVSSPAMPPDKDPDVRSNASVTFKSPRGTTTSSEPLVKALLLTLARCWPSSIAYRELVAAAASLASARPEAIESGIRDEVGSKAAMHILQLYANAQLNLSVCPTPCTVSPPAKPRVTALARLQAAESNIVTNLRHEWTPVSDLDQRIIPMLDGQHDNQQIANALVPLAEAGILKVNHQGQSVHGRSQLRAAIQTMVNSSLHELARLALVLDDSAQAC